MTTICGNENVNLNRNPNWDCDRGLA
jgi:hypothetical protein